MSIVYDYSFSWFLIGVSLYKKPFSIYGTCDVRSVIREGNQFGNGLRTYLFNFPFEVVGVVAVFHKKDDFFFVFAVVVELDDVLVFELGLNHALLTCVS